MNKVKYDLKKHISAEERQKRFAEKRCLICGSDKHMMRECTDPVARKLRINAICADEDAYLDEICQDFLGGAADQSDVEDDVSQSESLNGTDGDDSDGIDSLE